MNKREQIALRHILGRQFAREARQRGIDAMFKEGQKVPRKEEIVSIEEKVNQEIMNNIPVTITRPDGTVVTYRGVNFDVK